MKTPDIVIDSPSFGNAVPGPSALAFDTDGNLWVSVFTSDKVVKIAAAALETPGSSAPVPPSRKAASARLKAWRSTAPATSGWPRTATSTVVRIDAAHLTSSGTGADLTIVALSPPPVIGPLSSPLGLAFDSDGNLWVDYEGSFARLTPADQAGTGTRTITPSVQIQPDVQSQPLGMAFDEFGGLWFADVTGQFACFGASQLDRVGHGEARHHHLEPDLGYAGWFALYPAPAFTPLAHALP